MNYAKEWYEKNKERILENKRRPENKPYLSQKQRAWNLANPTRYILNNCRSRAKREGIEFNLSIDDIIIPEVCPYLKIPLTLILGEGKQESNISIDRIDPTKGYIKGNVQIISKKANTMKSNASKEELITFARSILDVFA